VNRQVFITETSPIASCEVVAEKTKRSSGRITLNQYVILGTAPQLLEREGYDYVDLRSRRSLEPRSPTSFGGMSGSGLWRFSIAKVSDSVLKPFDFQLAGVAFYQLLDTDDEIATLRFHGPRSMYERSLPSVRNWLAKKQAPRQPPGFRRLIVWLHLRQQHDRKLCRLYRCYTTSVDLRK